MKRHYLFAMVCLALAAFQMAYIWTQNGSKPERPLGMEPLNTRHSSMSPNAGPRRHDSVKYNIVTMDKAFKHEQTPENRGRSILTPARMQELAEQTIAASSKAPETSWEESINAIRESHVSPREKSTKFLQMIPQLPLAGQLETVEQLMFHIEDGDMDLLQPLLSNTAIPRPVLDSVFDDLLNRPSQIHLDASVSILRFPSHPLRGAALENLRTWIGEDFGDSADDWHQAAHSFLVWEKEHAAYMNESHDNKDHAEIADR